jgi:hypothetical protein
MGTAGHASLRRRGRSPFVLELSSNRASRFVRSAFYCHFTCRDEAETVQWTRAQPPFLSLASRRRLSEILHLMHKGPARGPLFSPPAALLLCSHPRYIGGMLWRVLAFMRKRDELFRNVPANIHELRLALAGLPQDMKVLADSETGVSENSIEALCARTTWPSDLVVTTPRKLHPKSVVKISKA